MTKTYSVTAANKFFYQRLVVNAVSPEQAADKFQAFLRLPENEQAEAEEYEMGINANDEAPFVDATDYFYQFDFDAIEETDYFPRWSGTPTDDVQVIAADGNG